MFAGREDETPDLVLYWFWSWNALGCSQMCLPGSCRIPFDVANPFLWRFCPLVFMDFTPSQSEPLLGWGVSYCFFEDYLSWRGMIYIILCHFCGLFDMFPSLLFPVDFIPSLSEPLLGWGVSYCFFKDNPSWRSLICIFLIHFISLLAVFPSLFFPADSEDFCSFL